jgi:teichoic acid transport system permease protein
MSIDLAQFAADNGLRKLGSRPRLSAYLKEAWSRRAFAFAYARYSLDSANARNRLGKAWVLLVPGIQIGIYGLIFGVILGSSRPDNFIPYLVAGITVFRFITGSFAVGARAISANIGMIRALRFPRVLLPFTTVINQLYSSLPMFALMFVLLPFFGEIPRWDWLLMIPVIGLAFIFSFGLTMIAARLTVKSSDVEKLIPFIVRIAFYVSGVFWSVEKLLGPLGLMAWAHLNPLYVFLTLARGAVVTGYTATLYDWGIASAWAIVTLVGGFVYFFRSENRYGRNV